jgi:hypothetical protein
VEAKPIPAPKAEKPPVIGRLRGMLQRLFKKN